MEEVCSWGGAGAKAKSAFSFPKVFLTVFLYLGKLYSPNFPRRWLFPILFPKSFAEAAATIFKSQLLVF